MQQPDRGARAVGTIESDGNGGKPQQTAQHAKQEARHIGETAKQESRQVADSARQEAHGIAQDLRNQGENLARRALEELRHEANTQTTKTAERLQELASQADALLAGHPEQAGALDDLLQKAGDTLDQVAQQLRSKEPAELVDEVKSFARRRPGAFLLGAAAIGFATGRLGRDLKSGGQHQSGGVPQPQQQGHATPATPPTAPVAAPAAGAAVIVEPPAREEDWR